MDNRGTSFSVHLDRFTTKQSGIQFPYLKAIYDSIDFTQYESPSPFIISQRKSFIYTNFSNYCLIQTFNYSLTPQNYVYGIIRPKTTKKKSCHINSTSVLFVKKKLELDTLQIRTKKYILDFFSNMVNDSF